MEKSHYKRSNGKNVFTDFKHHAKSWANSKRMRSRRIRQQLKSELRPTQMSVTKMRGDIMCDYDEAFTQKEMLEETNRCKDCKFDCPNKGKQ